MHIRTIRTTCEHTLFKRPSTLVAQGPVSSLRPHAHTNHTNHTKHMRAHALSTLFFACQCLIKDIRNTCAYTSSEKVVLSHLKRQTSAYVSIVSIRQHISAYSRTYATHAPKEAYVSIRQHTSAYVSISVSIQGHMQHTLLKRQMNTSRRFLLMSLLLTAYNLVSSKHSLCSSNIHLV